MALLANMEDEKMNDGTIYFLLERILKDAGMERVALQTEGVLYRSYNVNCLQYLLIYPMDKAISAKEFLKNQSEIFDKLDREVQQKDFGKNVSCLICIDEKMAINEKLYLEKEILAIEEDPYYFKKLVLLYTMESAQALLEDMGKLDAIEYLKKVCFASEQFDSFIQNEDSLYRLASRLLIKLPFIPIDIIGIEAPVELSEKMKEDAQKEKLEELRECINNMDSQQFKNDAVDWISKGGDTFELQMQNLDHLLNSLTKSDGRQTE